MKTKAILTIFLLTIFLLLTSCIPKDKYLIDLRDSDGDGVIDVLDQELDSPSGCPVDTRGIVLDSDADGIIDCEDKEPFSPPGIEIDRYGVAQIPAQMSISESDIFEIVEARMRAMELPQSTYEEFVNVNNINFSEFILPPPDYSKRDTFGVHTLFPSAITFGDIDKFLSEKLRAAGFEDESGKSRFHYFQIKQNEDFNGIAVLTAMEQIDEKGDAIEERFSEKVGKRKPQSIWEYIALPLNTGYFRFFAFLITDNYYGSENEKLYFKNEAFNTFKTGEKELPYLISNLSISEGIKLSVLVYEFEQKENMKNGAPLSMKNISVTDHLQKANIKLGE